MRDTLHGGFAATTQKQEHDSTVNANEQRESIGKAIDLMQVRSGARGGAQASASGA